MNFLAHALLSGPSSKVMVGNLMGDFVKGRLTDGGDLEIRVGLRLHRRIDAFTDAHPLHRRSRNRIGPERRRYAGIIVDLAYDHFLTVHWDAFCRVALPAFIARAYRDLEAHESLLPDRMRALLPRMVGEDWLGSCRTVSGLAAVMRRVSLRLKRENPLGRGALDVAACYRGLEADFLAFYPELDAYAGTELAGGPAAVEPGRRRGAA